MRYLGLDLGTKTLGISVSDLTNTIASNMKTIKFETYDEIWNELDQIISDYKITTFVLGYPKNMNNTIGNAALRSTEFKEILENKYSLPVELEDERLTSFIANSAMINAGVRRNKRKKKVDAMAATIILSAYLNRKRGI